MSESETVLRQVLEERARLRRAALEHVVLAHKDLLKAKERYARAVVEAHTYGAKNTEIARRVGLSETAIRTFLKRREDTDD